MINRAKYKICMVICMLFVMQSCYNYRNTGLLQTNNKSLPEYEKVEYTPYRLRVNDELIYRLITTDETLAKVIAGNSSSSLTYVNSYRVNDDGTVDLPFLDSIPVHVDLDDGLERAGGSDSGVDVSPFDGGRRISDGLLFAVEEKEVGSDRNGHDDDDNRYLFHCIFCFIVR